MGANDDGLVWSEFGSPVSLSDVKWGKHFIGEAISQESPLNESDVTSAHSSPHRTLHPALGQF